MKTIEVIVGSLILLEASFYTFVDGSLALATHAEIVTGRSLSRTLPSVLVHEPFLVSVELD